MQMRILSTFLLVGAFLLGAWGNVIAAAYCPRYLSNRECHLKPEPRQPKEVDNKSSCQHEMADTDMADMQMDDMEMGSEATPEVSEASGIESQPVEVKMESAAELVAIDFPTQPCGHCWMHSQPASGTATIVGSDPSKRLVETIAPQSSVSAALPTTSIIRITPVEHGPPGNSFPRHVLINVFRI